MASTCCFCDAPATVMDLEYDEPYCAKCAKEQGVLDIPHRDITDPDPED